MLTRLAAARAVRVPVPTLARARLAVIAIVLGVLLAVAVGAIPVLARSSPRRRPSSPSCRGLEAGAARAAQPAPEPCRPPGWR